MSTKSSVGPKAAYAGDDTQAKSVAGEATPGARSSKKQRYYVAKDAAALWDAIGWLRADPEKTFVAVIEEAPSVEVVGAKKRRRVTV